MLSLLVIATGFVAGVTGSWSPCGFSMVETLGPRGYAGGLRVTAAACATFTLGALAGGVITFGGLALAGRAIGAAAPAVAAALALAAALAEARGARIVPQIRRQVPESWRRVVPVPLAAAGYGVLLGLGFTTFVLTYAVWAIAGASVALGDPALGLATGLAFGAGRALPVIVLAPLQGEAAHAAMAERPRLLRGLRAADAAALAACALALIATPARAATVQRVAVNGSDPVALGGALAWQVPGANGSLVDPSGVRALPGRDPVLAPGVVGWRNGDVLSLADPVTLSVQRTVAIPGTTAVAVGELGRPVVWRANTPAGGEALYVRQDDSTAPVLLASVGPGRQIGRPALDGIHVVFHLAGNTGTRIVEVDLTTNTAYRLRVESGVQLLNPSLQGGKLLYVRSSATRQQLRVGPDQPGPTFEDEAIYGTTPTIRRDSEREPGQGRHRHYRDGHAIPHPPLAPRAPATQQLTLWTTALSADWAYVTRLRARRGFATTASLLRVAR